MTSFKYTVPSCNSFCFNDQDLTLIDRINTAYITPYCFLDMFSFIGKVKFGQNFAFKNSMILNKSEPTLFINSYQLSFDTIHIKSRPLRMWGSKGKWFGKKYERSKVDQGGALAVMRYYIMFIKT